MALTPHPPRAHRSLRSRAGTDPVERWISSMRTGQRLGEGEIGARVVQLELFCQTHGSTPGELLLSWQQFAAEDGGYHDAVADYLRHNGIDVMLASGRA